MYKNIQLLLYYHNFLKFLHALKESNPRHLILEINVLPTELKALVKF